MKQEESALDSESRKKAKKKHRKDEEARIAAPSEGGRGLEATRVVDLLRDVLAGLSGGLRVVADEVDDYHSPAEPVGIGVDEVAIAVGFGRHVAARLVALEHGLVVGLGRIWAEEVWRGVLQCFGDCAELVRRGLGGGVHVDLDPGGADGALPGIDGDVGVLALGRAGDSPGLDKREAIARKVREEIGGRGAGGAVARRGRAVVIAAGGAKCQCQRREGR